MGKRGASLGDIKVPVNDDLEGIAALCPGASEMRLRHKFDTGLKSSTMSFVSVQPLTMLPRLKWMPAGESLSLEHLSPS